MSRYKMARDNQSERGKVRIVVFEMEGSDKAISESLSTIANALSRPQAPTKTVMLPMQPTEAKGLQDEPQSRLFQEEEFEEIENRVTPAKSSKPRKIYTPNVVQLELESGDIPWVQYAAQKNPQSHNGKFLVAMEWLKNSLALESVSVDHVFTLYKSAKWSTAMPDFTAPFRTLLKERLVVRKERGSYAINHIGSQRVEEMNGS